MMEIMKVIFVAGACVFLLVINNYYWKDSATIAFLIGWMGALAYKWVLE